MRWDIGIDFGTEMVRVAELKKGLSVSAASRLAFRDGRDVPICCGDVAWRIRGKTCSGVEVCAPLKDGVLSSNLYTDRYLRWLYRQCPDTTKGKRFGVMISAAPFARVVQQEAMMTAAVDAGATEVCLVRSDTAAAVGAGLDITLPEAKMVVDVGAGKITATVFTMGRVAGFGYIPYGLDRLDEKIMRLVRAEKGFRIGMKSAREIKHTLGTALPMAAPEDLIMHMTGISMEDRMPKQFDLENTMIVAVCEEMVREIVQLCVTVLSEVPDGIAADLYDAGVVLTGAGAELEGLNKRIGDALGIPCKIADAPAQASAAGLFEIMRNAEAYRAAIMGSSSRGSGR